MRSVHFHDYDTTIHAWRFIRLTEADPVLSVHHGEKHEEGWSSHSLRWTFYPEEGVVTCDWIDDGRDCDGRMTQSGRLICPVDQLAARDVYADGNAEASEEGPLPFRAPEWTDGGRWQRDYNAEAAGY